MKKSPHLTMATDTTPPANPAAMEDILSSIRTSVAEETAKVGSGSADLIDAAAAQDGAEDDVLELSAADMVAKPATNGETEELIDIAAFASSGETKPVDAETAAALAADALEDSPTAEEPVAKPAAEGGAADEFDRLLAEISQDQQQQVAASEITKQALMAEEEPLGAGEAAAIAEGANLANQVETAAVTAMTEGAFKVSQSHGPEGVQIAFPAEVLAMALRPMVQEWLSKNLAGVVEKLVKEEITKLAQN